MTIAQEQTQAYGEVFTRRWVVETVLDLAGYDAAKDLGEQTLVEPSVGSGAFLIPAIERLLRSAAAHQRAYESLSGAIRAYDIQPGNIARCRAAASALLTEAGCASDLASELAETWLIEQDFLLAGDLLSSDIPEASYVVGNPPYIRLEDLPADVTAEYRSRWTTMGGRADIYVGFIERGLRVLKPGGALGFICADRWMRNQYGAGLRQLVSSEFAVRDVWVMHDVDAFESQVSAYPAIVTIARENQGPAVVVDTTQAFGELSAQALSEWSREGVGDEQSGNGYRAHRLPGWFAGDDMWPAGPPELLALIEHLVDNFGPLHDPATGTKVSIGVATGADQVYVVKGEPDIESDRILPLSMTRDLRTGVFEWSGYHLVNPWGSDGKLVDLADYPRMEKHLSGANGAVKGRFVAKKAPESWYRTIDKVDGALTAKPKLLLQDMRNEINPVLEPGGYYPHHNLYYVTSDTWDMEVLGGLLLSRIAQAFVEAFAVRMRGGTLRFQAQYLKKIRVPAAADIPDDTAERLRQAFRGRDRDAATRASESAYGVPEGGIVTDPVDEFDAAVRAFWTGRDLQTQKQVESGKIDAGTRGAVTGGQHLAPLQQAVAAHFRTDQLPELEIKYTGSLPLPGFYRKQKEWDIVVTLGDVLVAAVEFKSQVGSFGNNFNNRNEEAMGNAVDVWRAYEEGFFGSVRPWLAFVMVVESIPKSNSVVRDRSQPLFPSDPIFDGTSYIDRYRILLDRLERERLYDATVLVATEPGHGVHEDPEPKLGLHNLRAAIAGRMAYIENLKAPGSGTSRK